jgi:DUF2939 family protein
MLDKAMLEIARPECGAQFQTKDAVALTERIDFPALRRSLTKQIVQEYLKLTGKKFPWQSLWLTLSLPD